MKTPIWQWVLVAIAVMCLGAQWYALAHAPARGRAPAAAKP